jgi:hypothetical protein
VFGNHAFITGPGGVGIADLNSLVDLPDGVALVEATGINDQGQVAALGTVQIIPKPSAYVMLLAGLLFVGVISRRSLHESRERDISQAAHQAVEIYACRFFRTRPQ